MAQYEDNLAATSLLRYTPVDHGRIDLTDDLALTYWRRRLKCSASALVEAIESVGIEADRIEEYVALRRH